MPFKLKLIEMELGILRKLRLIKEFFIYQLYIQINFRYFIYYNLIVGERKFEPLKNISIRIPQIDEVSIEL